MKISNERLGIGIPLSFTHIPSPFFHSFALMEKPDFEYIPLSGGPIDEMRNLIVKQALATGCSRLIMMDTDMVYHHKTLTRLMEHNLPVVGALCFRRYPPFDPLMFTGKINGYKLIEEWEPESLVEVDATGTGCLMFDLRIFEELPYPWFRFRHNPDPNSFGTVGEDIGLCSDLREKGIKIFVDTSIPAGHLGMLEVTRETWLLYKGMKEIKQRNENTIGGT
jgi:hypothetical protein